MAEALGETTEGSTGSPLLLAAAGLAVAALVPVSRRTNPATAHISGTAAGAPPSEPPPSHDIRFAPSPVTTPGRAETGSAFGATITGAESDVAETGSAADTSAAADEAGTLTRLSTAAAGLTAAPDSTTSGNTTGATGASEGTAPSAGTDEFDCRAGELS
ncbi:MAG: hypothetical protein KDB45_01100 [Mycobacterium sp.]|nr:hypothetical protein [Mycobacterium sp.]